MNQLSSWVMSKNNLCSPIEQYVDLTKKIGILSHYCAFTTPRPSKAIRSTEENWHVDSLLKTYCPVLYKRARAIYEPTWHFESCLWNVFPSLTRQYVENMNKAERLIHLEIFQPSFRYKSIRWTNVQYCHLESCFKSPPRDQLQSNAPNIWRKLTCGAIFAHLPPSTLQSNTFNTWTKLTCWVIVVDLTPISPTEHYL